MCHNIYKWLFSRVFSNVYFFLKVVLIVCSTSSISYVLYLLFSLLARSASLLYCSSSQTALHRPLHATEWSFSRIFQILIAYFRILVAEVPGIMCCVCLWLCVPRFSVALAAVGELWFYHSLVLHISVRFILGAFNRLCFSTLCLVEERNISSYSLVDVIRINAVHSYIHLYIVCTCMLIIMCLILPMLWEVPGQSKLKPLKLLQKFKSSGLSEKAQ